MNWPLFISELTFVLILFDIIFYGFTTLILKFGKPYRGLLKKGILIEDQGNEISYNTWQGAIIRSLVLTDEFLIPTQNYLTSIENINIDRIIAFQIKRILFRKNRKRLILYITTDNRVKKLKFTTKKATEWKNILRSLNIAESMK